MLKALLWKEWRETRLFFFDGFDRSYLLSIIE